MMPATADDVAAAAHFLIAACEPASQDNPHRAGFIARMLATRDYSRAELGQAMREAPFRPMYGEALRLDVVQAIVDESRELRARLARPITAGERDELLDRLHHEGVTADHFPCCGFGDRNEERYLYRSEPLSGPPGQPTIPEPNHASRRPDEPFPLIRSEAR